jgi:hypothetical protein
VKSKVTTPEMIARRLVYSLGYHTVCTSGSCPGLLTWYFLGFAKSSMLAAAFGTCIRAVAVASLQQGEAIGSRSCNEMLPATSVNLVVSAATAGAF